MMNSDTESIDTRGSKTFWEEVSTTRWGQYITEVERRSIQQAHEIAGPTSVAIEIGAEGGRWSKLLSDLGWKMICTDIDPDSLAICQQLIPTAQCIRVDEDAKELPCETSSTRLLLCIEVPPVIESDWFIEESFRCLEAGGVVVGVFLNRRSMRGMMKRFRERDDSCPFYGKVYSDWRQRFVDRGFQMVSEEGICWFPFGRQSNSLLIPPATSLERRLGLRRLVSISPWIVFVAQKQSIEH